MLSEQWQNATVTYGAALLLGINAIYQSDMISLQKAIEYLETKALAYPFLQHTAINTQTVDGKYGDHMSDAVRRFQRQFGLSADGILGSNTWNRIITVHAALTSGNPTPVTTPYPGTVLSTGSSGDSVRFVQSYLNAVAGRAFLTVDGIYGQNVTRAVSSFQAANSLKVDGKVGSGTWSVLIPAFNQTL